MKKPIPQKLDLLIITTNFCRADEERTPYGVSCLVNAFRRGESAKSGRIRSFTYDLNRHFDSETGKFKINFKKIARFLARKIVKSGCNVVAFSTFAWSDLIFTKTMAILAWRKNHPLIVLGGPMVIGSLAELQGLYPHADFFIESYGEKVFANLREYLLQAHEGGSRLIKDLPVFEELVSPYFSNLIKIEKGMSVRMELRRGCLFNCAFCRHRNPEKKVFCVDCAQNHQRELMLFKEKQVGKINVLDPYFNDVRPEFKEISRAFLQNVRDLQIDTKISLQIRPEMLDDEYLNIAQTMPNLIFEIGIQSLDDAVIAKINRGGKDTRKKVLEKLAEVARRKITSEITLIYGLPLQTAKSFASDIATLTSLGFSKISAFPLQIYRGTELFSTYRKFGLKTRLNEIGILEVCDNPTRDFAKMRAIATNLKN
ncbi:MAG: hypothetical protein IJ158_00695 [Treponema sp.]|nr:hypothetical protein [Treponema sp.]